MKIGILGSGVVGQTLGAALARKGHEVMLGTRTPGDLEQKRGLGEQSLAAWLEATGGRGRVGTFAETAAFGEALMNATGGSASLQALELAGEDNLADKVLVDIANPLDFSQGMPPRLFIANDDSLGEQIQAAFPRLRVVKTLNTTNTSVMADPEQLAGGDHTMFVCGNDAEAKERVTGWLGDWFGWRDVIDLGDITNARGTEMLLPIWVRLRGALGTPTFNFKVVR